jgi:hypothetical protein
MTSSLSITPETASVKRKSPMPFLADPITSPKGKAKAIPQSENEEGFERVLSRDEKRKQRKVDKHRPQFQFDTSYFRLGKKIGIAVGWDLQGKGRAHRKQSILGIWC